MQRFKTVLGDIGAENLGITLPHEHICCYLSYFEKMSGKVYLDKDALIERSVEYLKYMKENYHLSTIVDCTPVNIGRDISLLKEVSAKSGVNIICATGFYYTEEAMLFDISADFIRQRVLEDIKNTNAGIIKFAVETEDMSPYSQKMLSVLCDVQKETGLPFCIHTNGNNKNGYAVLDFVLKKGILPPSITIGHLSDSDDSDYVAEIAKSGCFIGLDRIYKSESEAYVTKKAADIYTLCEKGYANRLLLSHDALCFNGFHTDAKIREDNPYTMIFEHLIPKLFEMGFCQKDIEKLFARNPQDMLLCR